MPKAVISPSPIVPGTRPRLAAVARILEGYAERGVFRGYSQDMRPASALFRVLWHRGRVFELFFEPQKNTLRFPFLLPEVEAEMARDLKAFLNARFSLELPDHRRLDPEKIRIQLSRRSGKVALAVQVLDGDDEYAVRKLIHLVHEIFLTFLLDGRYYEYMVDNFDLDPDRV